MLDLLARVATLDNTSAEIIAAAESDIVEMRAASAKRGLATAVLDGSTIGDDLAFFEAIAQAWSFPEYFGHNWYAVDDCLADLSWRPAAGYVTFIAGADAVMRRNPGLAIDIIRSFISAGALWQDAEASELRQSHPAPFHLVLVMTK